jgi:hypothetical protein
MLRGLRLSVVAVVLALAGPAFAITPKFKWWQDHTALYLSVAAVCTPESKVVEVSNWQFSLACTTISGQQVSLAFTFREPVADSAKPTSCSTKNGGYCTLVGEGLHLSG